MITFYPLWITLAKKRLKKSDLYQVTSSATIARMGRDEYVSLDVIDKICEFLDCPISDVMVRAPKEKGEGPSE